MLRLAAREEEAVAAAGPVGDYADEEESSGCEAEGQSAAEADPPGRPNGQCGRQALIIRSRLELSVSIRKYMIPIPQVS